MTDFSLRKASMKDFGSVYSMVCELEEEQFDRTIFKNIFKTNLANPNIHYVVAIYENKLVGFISLHIQPLLHHNGNAAEIHELFVDSQVRGRGIGRALVAHAKKIAEANKAKVFEVACNIKREKTHLFYQNEGLGRSHYKFTSTAILT